MAHPEHDSLVIFLHGVGSSGASMAPMAADWEQFLPASCFAAPDAPYAFDDGPGHQWYSMTAVTEVDRPQRVAAARAGFDRLMNTVIHDHGFTRHLGKVAFVGFSQGATMALDAIASGRWPIGAALSFSGRFASPPPLAPAKSTQVLIVHGTDDTAVPVGESEKAAAALEASGLSVETVIFPGLGHAISPEGVQRACAFLAKAFGEAGDPAS